MDKCIIADGLVVRHVQSRAEVVPTNELDQHRVSEYELLPGIWELPLAQATFRLRGIGGQIKLERQLESSGKTYEIPWAWDLSFGYVVVGDRWIPFDSDVVGTQSCKIKSLEIADFANISLPEYLAVLRLHSSGVIKVELEESAIEAARNSGKFVTLPKFQFKPYDYQRRGIEWLVSLHSSGIGGILADGMGLGKTIQLIGLIDAVLESDNDARVLVVVPGSLIVNWCAELIKFSNYADSAQIHHGAQRSNDPRFIASKRIVVATYDTVFQDSWLFASLEFSLVVCDEAHRLRNPTSKKREAIASLNAKSKILATGTPFNNHLLDLWSLTEIVAPGVLGDLQDFESIVANTPADAAIIANRMLPLILRRTSDDANLQLPEQVSSRVVFVLSEDEAEEYMQIKRGEHPCAFGAKGLGTISPRRQFCAHPSSLSDSPNPFRGAKIEYLLDKLEEIWETNEKAIIFVAGFTKPLDLVAAAVAQKFGGPNVYQLDGRTEQLARGAIVHRFSEHQNSAALIMNTDVGGEGLNITAANHVFHVSPAWNPAKIDQATFRVSRPGQTKTTFIYEFIYDQTIESTMIDLVDAKKEISDAALLAAEIEGSEKRSTLQLNGE